MENPTSLLEFQNHVRKKAKVSYSRRPGAISAFYDEGDGRRRAEIDGGCKL